MTVLFDNSMNVFNLLLEIFLQGVDLLRLLLQFNLNLAVLRVERPQLRNQLVGSFRGKDTGNLIVQGFRG